MTLLSLPKFIRCVAAVSAAAMVCGSSVGLAQSSTATPSTANDIQVTITNEGNSDFTLTPLWFAFQNGGFDAFDVGSAASPAIEAIAEDGIVGGLIADFDASGQPGNRQGVVTAPGGFAGAPVIEPGETGTAYITPINPANYQYFSFASMVIPSNDTFLGNDDPMQYQVFNSAGEINDPSGTFTIQIFAEDLLDSGTEVNNAMGAAFSTAGGTGTTEGGVIGAAGDLSEMLGTSTPSGITISDLITQGELVATITVSQIPEPSTAALSLLGALGVGLVARRRS